MTLEQLEKAKEIVETIRRVEGNLELVDNAIKHGSVLACSPGHGSCHHELMGGWGLGPTPNFKAANVSALTMLRSAFQKDLDDLKAALAAI